MNHDHHRTGRNLGVDDVSPNGAVAAFTSSWPINPYTGEPMTQGNEPGDFNFSTATRMPDRSYMGYVYGILGDGESFSVEFDY